MTTEEKKTAFELAKYLSDAMRALSESHAQRIEQTVTNAKFHTHKWNAICTVCGASMVVEKTAPRAISTMAMGKIVVMEYVMVCPGKCVTPNGARCRERSPELSALVARGANYGYDIEVFVGLQRFMYNRQRLEIKDMISQSAHVDISDGEISALEERFLVHLELFHARNAEALKSAMLKDGGYPLHIDATCECGRGTTLAFYSGWRGWALGAWKIPSEREEAISPRLKEVEDMFGAPIAYVTDLGKGMMSATALAAASHDMPPAIFVCQMHFLKALGKSILEKEHDKLTAALRGLKVKKSLGGISKQIGHKLGKGASCMRVEIAAWAGSCDMPPLPEGLLGIGIARVICQWVLDYTADCKNLRFPFALPQLCLFNRCEQASKAIVNLRKHAVFDYSVSRFLERTQAALLPVLSDKGVCRAVKALREKNRIFGGLRSALRLDTDIQSEICNPAVPNLPNGTELINSIEECAGAYVSWVKRACSSKQGTNAELAAMRVLLEYMDKYGEFLWGHNIDLGDGRFRYAGRTNCAIEAFFGGYKHGERRRSGRKCLTYDLENSPPVSLLVANLAKADYVDIICGGSLDNLPMIFADIDRQLWLDKCTVADNAADAGMVSDTSDVVSTALPSADRRFVRSKMVNMLIDNAASAKPMLYPLVDSFIGMSIDDAASPGIPIVQSCPVTMLAKSIISEPTPSYHLS